MACAEGAIRGPGGCRWQLRGRSDCDIDAHDLTVSINQRAAAVPRVDRGIRLEQIVQGLSLRREHRAIECADDADRDGGASLQGEGVPDGDHGFTDFEGRAPAEFGRNQIRSGDSDEGEIEQKITSDDSPRCEPAGRESHHDAGHALHQMVIGQDVPAGIEDHAGAGARRGPVLGASLGNATREHGDDRRTDFGYDGGYRQFRERRRFIGIVACAVRRRAEAEEGE